MSNFCVALEKRPMTVKFSKLCFESFHHLTDRRCCVQITQILFDWKPVKSCVIYPTASQTDVTARITPKICQGQPPAICSQGTRLHPNQFTFGGVIAECVNAVFCPVEYFHDRRFEPMNIHCVRKKEDTKLMAVTLSFLNRFSKFCH